MIQSLCCYAELQWNKGTKRELCVQNTLWKMAKRELVNSWTCWNSSSRFLPTSLLHGLIYYWLCLSLPTPNSNAAEWFRQLTGAVKWKASLNGVIVEFHSIPLKWCGNMKGSDQLSALRETWGDRAWSRASRSLLSSVGGDERGAQRTNGLPLCLQIIRLINVFTPQKSLEEFQDLWVAAAATIDSLFFYMVH